MKEKQSFIIYYEWEEMLQFMTDSQIAEILRAMFSYAKRGEIPEFSSPLLNTTFCVIKYAIERDKYLYEQKCKKNAENISKRWNKEHNHSENKIPPYTKHTDNDNDNENENENENENDNENDNENENENENDKNNISSSPSAKDRATEGAYTEDFLDFWKEYPRKTGKGEAFRSWLKISPTKEEKAKISSALVWQKRSAQWNDTGFGKFIPLPATYLNQRRWEDEPDTLFDSDITNPDKYKDDEDDFDITDYLKENNSE